MRRGRSFSSLVPVLLPFAVGIVAIVVGLVLSSSLSDYFVYLGTSAVTASIAVLGLGIVTGSAGMIALCQLTFAAVGAWVVSGLNVINAPGGFIIWLVLGALAAGVVGILIGLPALRLRGVNLAVVTLAFAAAADSTLVQIQFPGAQKGTSVLRPDAFSTDNSYFFFGVIVLVVCAVIVYFVQRSRWGSGWRFVAFSERGTAAVGASVRTSKLTAFAASAILGGLSGGLIAGQVGLSFESSYIPLQSLALYVLAVMSGTHLIDMAVFAGILWVAVPEILRRLGIPQNWAFVLFGVLGVQALASGGNLGMLIRGFWWNRQLRRSGVVTGTLATDAEPSPDDDLAAADATAGTSSPVSTAEVDAAGSRRESGSVAVAERQSASVLPAREPGDPLLVVEGLTVRFGSVTALDGVSLTVRTGALMGLIGPNGAGKSTFVDAITGFLPRHEGTVSLGGRPLHGLSPTKRARLGLRRTFQQDRVPPTLTIDGYVRFVARRRLDAAEIADTLDFFGCPAANTRLASVDVGTRRLIEVAANLLSSPRILLLDEPAAGLSHEEHVELGQRLVQVPDRFGTSLLLIEHDLDMVRSVCSDITVLNFGEVLASGPQEEVLANPDVIKAYMGETEML